MTTNEIRSKFLNFFKSKNHSIIASDSVVPKNDPTVLFTTAGMQQFKPQFLGHIDGFIRAATCQKCLRTDDLDVVGKTNFHHTFFEMLGNFSFGDYFKKEAIAWSWEFLTIEMKLPKEKLWISVYKDDEEAYGIWLNEIKIPANRIVKLGDKSNFWPSNARLNGPNGPCGPCSEIFYDYGVNPNCSNGTRCDPDCSCGRFSEIWNLVFTQFNRKEGGILEPLPAKNIDTGMGLERLVAVVQGKKSNYQTDIFIPILSEVKKQISNITEFEARIIADHLRAIVFSIGDGVVPSNDGRGYIVKKLIIIASDIALKYGKQKSLIHELSLTVVDVMQTSYPELRGKTNEIISAIKIVEEAYIRVYNDILPEFTEKAILLAKKNEAKALGELIFLYRDTHGLTVPTIKSALFKVAVDQKLEEEAFKVFETLMKEQQEKSRASSKMTGDVFTDAGIKLDVLKTEFLGYAETHAKAKVLKFVQEGNNVKIILDRTPFYAESGGQMGDAGFIKNDSGVVKVTDTQKINDIYIHAGILEKGQIKEFDSVVAQIDVQRRAQIMSNHTSTHLLQSALRLVLGNHIKQQGSLVSDEHLRFDFSHTGAVKSEEIEKIEKYLNQYIASNDKVITEVLPLEEAKKKGALAFFAEKYGQTVRVVSVGNYSTEFCGGTHVANTAQIESVKIVSEGSVAQGIRRIEAVTGKGPVEAFLKQKELEVREKEQQLQLRQQEKINQAARFEQIKSSIDDVLKNVQKVKDFNVVTYCFNDIDMGMLRKLSDILKQKLPSSIFILGAKTEEDASLIVSVTDDLVAQGIKANEIINRIAPLFGANGGGKPQIAQAGSKEIQKLESALAQAKNFI